ncbi:SPOR domain-containing protein [Deinococcota bacterium DY0809b]
MRWLRENWIDALIFAVFAVTVVGIVLFLTGVNPFKTKAPSGVTAPVPIATPAQDEAATPGVDAEAPMAEEPVTVVPLLPAAPEAAPEEPVGAQPSESAAAPPAAGSAASPGRTEVAPPPAAPAGPETGIFRVSVGAFGNPLNALALAQKLEAQGFAVRLEPVGRVTRVAVGPFMRRGDAVRAAERLATYEPQIYRGDSPEPTQTYLQVGAFKQLASAEATVRALRDQGFSPVVLQYRKPWIKVWVGPVAPEQLTALKRRLVEAGFEVVEVR